MFLVRETWMVLCATCIQVSCIKFLVRETWTVCHRLYRVHTDAGKVWKVLEFNVEIIKALKTVENDHRYGKVWKNP